MNTLRFFRLITVFSLIFASLGVPQIAQADSPAVALFDDFADGELNNNPTWESLNSAWAIVAGQLHTDGLIHDGSDRYISILNSYFSSDGGATSYIETEYIEMSYFGVLKSVGNPQIGRGIELHLVGEQPGQAYMLRLQKSVTSGASVNFFSFALSYDTPGGWVDLIVSNFEPEYDEEYVIKAIRENNVWTLYVDSQVIGSAPDPVGMTQLDRYFFEMIGSVIIDDVTLKITSSDPSFDCTDVTQIPQAECEALVALYNSTDGPNWANNTDWLGTNVPCSWYGVECEAGYISKLFLANNQLNGSIPSEIGSLTFVKELYLDNNQEITGIFPLGIRNLVNLEVLRLHHTQTAGTIPNWIGELTHLQRLHLENNQLTGSIPIEITTLANLETLNLSFNQLTGSIPTQFSNLTSLQQAYLGRNQFSGGFPTQFTLLPNLEVLHLYDSDLSGTLPAEIGDFPSITSLDLSNNAFSGPVPAEIGNLQSLQQLWLRNNDFIGEVPFGITNLTNLNLLDLSCNQLVSTDPTVQAFLDIESPGWQEAQCFPETNIIARLTLNQVDADGWPLGTELTITVEDPQTVLSPDYTDTGLVESADEVATSFNFFFGNDYTLKSGDEVTVEGGGITRIHTVADIHVTNVDVQGDKIYGTAGDGITSVNVRLWSSPIEMQRDAEVIDGIWVADFFVSTPEYAEYDIKPGDNGVARWFEGDGDFTTDYWEILNSRILARANEDRLEGHDWVIGSTVNFEIDDPSTGQNPDKTVSATVGTAPWDPNQPWFEIYLDNYDLKPGDVVTATDGTITKELIVEELEITDYDPSNELVHGTAQPGQLLYIQACDNFSCADRDETADQNGDWTANFAIPGEQDWEQATKDIGGGFWLDTNINDADGDMSRFGLSVPDARFHVQIVENNVEGYDWPVDEPVTITIDDPSNGVGVDFNDTQPVNPYHQGAPLGWVEFNDLGGIPLVPGLVITMSNGTFNKYHTVTDVVVTGLNMAEDVVSGTGTPGANLNVQYCNQSGCNWRRWALVQPDGTWEADFSVTGPGDDEQLILDIKPGVVGEALEPDGDSDHTDYRWGVRNPNIEARANDDTIGGYEWTLGATLDVQVDDPNTPETPDYSNQIEVGVADWNPNQTYFNLTVHNYDLKVGDLVTVTDGVAVKQLEVLNFAITDVNLQTDTAYGVGTPNTPFNTWACDSVTCVNRADVTDGDGNWSMNFAVPGDEDWEQDTMDIVPDTWVDSSMTDEDGDNTMFGLTVRLPQCQPGDSVSGTVYEHDGSTPVASALITIEDFNSGEMLFTIYADENGQYGCELPAGDYRIKATTDDFDYSQEYYNEAATDNETLIHITSFTQLGNINFTISPLPIAEHLTFNLENQFLQDVTVRRAIALGTDRQRILDEAFAPNGIFGEVLSSIVPPQHWTSAPVNLLDAYPYDPTEARALLASAGWVDTDNDGFRENAQNEELSFTFKTTPAAFRVASAEIFSQNMENIGIRITVETVPGGQFFGADGALGQHDYDIAEFGWASDTDNEPYVNSYLNDSSLNYGSYNNPAFDAAVINARAESSDAGKLPYLHEAQAILTQDLPVFPLFTRTTDWVAPPSVPLVFAISSEVNLGAVIATVENISVLNTMFEGLYTLDENDVLQPLGAHSEPVISNGGLTYTVHLRPDAVWSDGEPVTAEDYVTGILRVLDPNVGSDYGFILYPILNAQAFNEGTLMDGSQVGVHAVDSLTLEFTLEQPASHFKYLLAAPVMVPARQDVIDQFGDSWTRPENHVTNGPYRLKEYDASHVLLEANPNYVGPGVAHFSQIGFDIISDPDAQVQAYKDGTVDVLFSTSAQTIVSDPVLRNDMLALPSPGEHYVGFTAQVFPTNDPLVRKALAAAIDRQSLIDNVMMTSWRQEATGVIPPELPGYQGSQAGYGFNPAQAQAFLAQAGYPGGAGFPTLNVLVRQQGLAGDLMEAVAQQWESTLGITVHLEYLQNFEQGQILNDCRNNPTTCDYNAYIAGWMIDYPDAYSFLNDLFHPDGSYNQTQWDNASYRNLIALALSEPDEAQRIDYLQQAEQILVTEDAAVAPLVHLDYPVVIRPGIYPCYTLTLWSNLACWSDVDPAGDGMTADVIDSTGGTVITETNTLVVDVPANAIAEEVTLSVTDLGGNYQITAEQDELDVLNSFSVQPHGLQFSVPVTLTFAWDDTNNDGIVDGTTKPEANIFLRKDGEQITPACSVNPNCDVNANTLSVEVSSLSLFELATPVSAPDTTPPTITWLGNINDGDSFYYGFVPAEPTCTADDPSGLDGVCTVAGYESTLGQHTLTATARDTFGNEANETRSYSVLAWTLQGFYQPIDMNGVYNSVKGGSTVPLKFELFAGLNELTDPTYLKSLTYVIVTCDASTPTDEIETTVTESTGLRYDTGSGQFIYNWKTPKNPGTCYRLTLTSDDGSTLVAYFKLK